MNLYWDLRDPSCQAWFTRFLDETELISPLSRWRRVWWRPLADLIVFDHGEFLGRDGLATIPCYAYLLAESRKPKVITAFPLCRPYPFLRLFPLQGEADIKEEMSRWVKIAEAREQRQNRRPVLV